MSRTLLLADGSVTIQRVIELTFAHEDVRVMYGADGRRAMQMLETEQPDILLLDVDLPEMDGYALAAHVRRVPRLKDVPILLLAGAFEPVDQARARDVGSDGVILKPFEPQVVVTRVKELIDQRDRMAAPQPARGESPAAAAVAAARFAAAPEPARAAPPPPPVEPPKPARPETGPMRVASRDREQAAPLLEMPPVLDSLELPTGPIWEGAAASKSMDFHGVGTAHALDARRPALARAGAVDGTAESHAGECLYRAARRRAVGAAGRIGRVRDYGSLD